MKNSEWEENEQLQQRKTDNRSETDSICRRKARNDSVWEHALIHFDQQQQKNNK